MNVNYHIERLPFNRLPEFPVKAKAEFADSGNNFLQTLESTEAVLKFRENIS